MGSVVLIFLLVYTYKTVVDIICLMIDMFFAWLYYRDYRIYIFIKPHEATYWDCLIWVRSL